MLRRFVGKNDDQEKPSWAKSAYNVGIRAHQVVGMFSVIETVRRHKHPHSWWLNTPFVAAWAADKLYDRYRSVMLTPESHDMENGQCENTFYDGTENHVKVKFVQDGYLEITLWGGGLLDEEMVQKTPGKALGHVRLSRGAWRFASGWWEKQHTFSCFLTVDRVHDRELFVVRSLVRVYSDPRDMTMGKAIHLRPLTSWLCDMSKGGDATTQPPLLAWPPHRGSGTGSVERALGKKNTVVIFETSGSNVNSGLDTLRMFTARRASRPESGNKFILVHRIRGGAVRDWVRQQCETLLGNPTDPHVRILLHNTSDEAGEYEEWNEGENSIITLGGRGSVEGFSRNLGKWAPGSKLQFFSQMTVEQQQNLRNNLKKHLKSDFMWNDLVAPKTTVIFSKSKQCRL